MNSGDLDDTETYPGASVRSGVFYAHAPTLMFEPAAPIG
jgi:hypothetical protein